MLFPEKILVQPDKSQPKILFKKKLLVLKLVWGHFKQNIYFYFLEFLSKIIYTSFQEILFQLIFLVQNSFKNCFTSWNLELISLKTTPLFNHFSVCSHKHTFKNILWNYISKFFPLSFFQITWYIFFYWVIRK